MIFVTLASLCVATAGQGEERYALVDGRQVSTLERFQECDVCPEMIVLPSGHFRMGAPLSQSADIHSLIYRTQPGVPHGFAAEGPEHEVEIDLPIAMGRNEVTREEWVACVADSACTHVADPRILQPGGTFLNADDPRHPVIDVNYLDMLEYLAWLNWKVGTPAYRLPTEAEWEYAARAGTQTAFAQGDILTRDQANFAVMHIKGGKAVADPKNRKMPVKVDELNAANAWGLRHMSGNVVERTMSCWSERHLALSKQSEYLAEVKYVLNCNRVSKGGSFSSVADLARPAQRGFGRQHISGTASGFRVVRELERIK
jgi:formylglycine-generating enzyme required for sulfatase activity